MVIAKVLPHVERQDVTQSSMEMIREGCRKYFDKNFPNEPVWYPDCEFVEPSVNGDLHVVMFGSFLIRFLETGNWLSPSFKIWVLCESVRSVLVQLMGVPKRCVGVIPRVWVLPPPRDALVPLPKTLLAQAVNEEVSFVYAGRLSAPKNLEAVLWSVYFLQKEADLKVRAVIIGSSDDDTPVDRGRWILEGYGKGLKEFANQLDWNLPPQFVPKMPREEWVKQMYSHPLYINLSTFVWEDFGMALAQAQGAGWPAIVSMWGGQKEALGAGVAGIHRYQIGSIADDPRLVETRAHALVNSWRLGHSLSAEISDELMEHGTESDVSPCALSLSELNALRRQLIVRWGREMQLISREGVDAFADTAPGVEFFARYRELFSQFPVVDGACSILVVGDWTSTVKQAVDDFLESCFKRREEVIVMSAADLKEKEAWIYLVAAREIKILSGPSVHTDKLKRDLSRIQPLLQPERGVSVELSLS